MEALQVPVDDLARLCHLASLGKLLGGLIHNLNSPLHSLGMQMDVMQHVILKKSEISKDVSENLSKRITRMNEEFENLNNQIRIAGMRADLQETPVKRLDINHFLHEEIEFLKTNLYFKHNVETTMEEQGYAIVSIRMADTVLSSSFRTILEMNPFDPHAIPELSAEIHLFIAVLLLRNGGVQFKTDIHDGGTTIRILLSHQDRRE